MQTIETLANGQIVIPANLRQRFGIKQGSRLEIRQANDHLELYVLPDDPISLFRGSLKEEASMAAELIEEHRQEVEFEVLGDDLRRESV